MKTETQAKAAQDSRKVELSGTTLTFSLPDDFGIGWDYSYIRVYGASHQWAGSYDKTEVANFAHEALLKLPEVNAANLMIGLSCSVECQVTDVAAVVELQSRLQAVVDAFPVQPERQISIRGSHFYDSKVTEYDPEDFDIERVSDMPYLSYLAKYVPLAELRPELTDHDLIDLRNQADEHQRANKVGNVVIPVNG